MKTTTIILLVSRDFLLERIFKRLDELECNNTNLLVVVDGDINLFLKTKAMVTQSKYDNQLCVRADTAGKPSKSQIYRRKRIAELHNLASQYIQEADYVFTLEDDGLPPADSLVKLHEHMRAHPEAGFISGLQLGRWITSYPGGWLFDDPSDPHELRSVTLPEAPGLINVHAVGWYCCLVKKELYEGFEHEPGKNWGPDIRFGQVISSRGYKNYMDTSIVVDHFRENGTVVNLENTRPKSVCMKLDRGTWRFIRAIDKDKGV